MNTVLKLVPKETETRTCKKCGEIKDVSEFPTKAGYFLGKCRPCNLTYRREQNKRLSSDLVYKEKRAAQKAAWLKANPDQRSTKDRPDRLKRQYGVSSWEEIVGAYNDQEGLCANNGCRKEISLNGPSRKDRAVIDHCHKTGIFRALLCMKCNLDLGMIEKDQGRILGLMEYETKHSSTKE